jgi:hypothetical protein
VALREEPERQLLSQFLVALTGHAPNLDLDKKSLRVKVFCFVFPCTWRGYVILTWAAAYLSFSLSFLYPLFAVCLSHRASQVIGSSQ